MNHSLNKLNDCIFDYLVANANKAISVAKIFHDIRSGSGHRCDELTDSVNNKQRFLSICYSLDRNYKNVKKVYRNNKLYLLFQKDTKNTDVDQILYDDTSFDNGNWRDDYNLKNIIDYMCDNSMFDDFDSNYFSNNFNDNDSLIHLLIKYNRYDDLEKLLNSHNIDLNKKNTNNETPIDLAINLKNKKMIKILMNYWDEKPVKQLQRRSNNNHIVINTEPSYITYWKYIMNIVYLLGVWYIFTTLLTMYRYITY